MSVKYPPHLTAVSSPRRRRLALWVMMGCAAPTLMTALPCGAADAGRAKAAGEDQHVDIRVPSFRRTPTVQSVLGLLPGEYNEPLGTSIQLLPAAAPTAAPAGTAASTLSAAAGSEPAAALAANTPAPVAVAPISPQPAPAATMVTRENAKLGVPRLSWQVEVPSFDPPAQHVAMPPAAPTDDVIFAAPATPNAIAQNNAGNQGTVASPPQDVSQHAAQSAIMTANRRGFPAWIEPEITAVDTAPKGAVADDDLSQGSWRPRGEAQQPQPLRDPAPALTTPTSRGPSVAAPTLTSPALAAPQTNPSPNKVALPLNNSVGSGLQKLAPVESMPALDATPAWSGQADPLPALSSLPDRADADMFAEPLDSNPKIDGATNPHDGNNEGDGIGPVEVDQWDGDAINESDDTAASNPSLSTIDIKPLVIDSAEAMQPSTDIADLYTVPGQQSEKTEKSPSASSVPTPKPAISSTAKRDATGRVKTHDGAGAVEKLDPAIARMQQPILQTLRSFHAKTEQADARSNWGMMHAIMVYGVDTRIIARRRNYSAIAWMAGNNVCRGNRMMTTERGQIKAREGTGLQGHQSQWLATLSLASVPANYPLYADNQKFTIEDLVQVEAAACEDGKELTFTLIGLSHYLDTDATWVGVNGETWDFERLIAAELDQPIVGAACGGTHRLMGFAHALRKRRLEGKPVTGQWKRAEIFLDDFVQYTYSLQNRDGSFSTNWYESAQDNGDLSRKVQTTGHMLEFLLTHLPDEQLVNREVVSAVRFLTNSIRRLKMDDAGVGYRAHALRSLAMYHQRAYGIAPAYPPGQMAFGQHRNQHHR